MTAWPSAKAKCVLAALLGIGWEINVNPDRIARCRAQVGPIACLLSVRGEEIGPRMLARISKHTGLQPGDL